MRSRGVLISLLMLSAVMISGCSLETGPADKTYTDISLTEAQRLVSFTICLPSYLPNGLTSTPSVIYHAEMGDPKDADIRLRYYRPNEPTPLIEVFQKVSSIDLERYNTTEYGGRHVAESELIDWAIGWRNAQSVEGSVKVDAVQYEDNQNRWLFTISAPSTVLANMIEWVDKSKYYQVYARLPSEEAKHIAQSMKDCMTVSTITPSSK